MQAGELCLIRPRRDAHALRITRGPLTLFNVAFPGAILNDLCRRYPALHEIWRPVKPQPTVLRLTEAELQWLDSAAGELRRAPQDRMLLDCFLMGLINSFRQSQADPGACRPGCRKPRAIDAAAGEHDRGHPGLFQALPTVAGACGADAEKAHRHDTLMRCQPSAAGARCRLPAGCRGQNSDGCPRLRVQQSVVFLPGVPPPLRADAAPLPPAACHASRADGAGVMLAIITSTPFRSSWSNCAILARCKIHEPTFALQSVFERQGVNFIAGTAARQ